MKEGAHLEAIPELQRAYDLGHEDIVLYDLGQAYAFLGQPVYAIDALSKYLREGGARISSTQRSKIEAEIAKQELLVATLDIVSSVQGAVVRIDGVELGRTPMPKALRVNAGSHRLTAEAAGYLPWEQMLDLAGREHRSVEIVLASEMPMAPAAAAAPITEPAVPLAASSPAQEPTTALAASGSEQASASAGVNTRRLAAYVVGGLGVGALAVGTVFGVRAISKQNDSDDLCPNDRCSQEAVRLNDQAKTAAWVADFTIGAGLIAVGAATYLLIATPALDTGASHAMRVVPSVGPGQAGLTLGGVW